MNEMRFFMSFCLFVGIVVGAAALLSYHEDPGGVFTKNIKESDVAKILLSGHNVANAKNLNERLLQKAVIQNDPRAVDTIVLGSSRSLQIHRMNSSQTFFNHGISAGTLEDYVAILELYHEKGITPQTVIIGVDPWIFNGNKIIGNWITLNPEYQYGIARICSTAVLTPRAEQDGFGSDVDRYTSLIARPVVIASIHQVFNKTYFATDDDILGDVGIRLKDGAISYPGEYQNRSIGQIDADAYSYIHTDPIYGLGNYHTIEPYYKNQFEATVRYLKKSNTKVILFLPPYHPIVYQKFKTDPSYRVVGDVEAYLKEFALKENIPLVGSYDPTCLNLTSMDFYDGMHPRREAVEKIFTERLSCAGPEQ